MSVCTAFAGAVALFHLASEEGGSVVDAAFGDALRGAPTEALALAAFVVCTAASAVPVALVTASEGAAAERAKKARDAPEPASPSKRAARSPSPRSPRSSEK